mgnify:CR=1 FL=1
MNIGRPKLLIKRDVQLNLKISPQEKQKISSIAKKFNISMTEALLRGIDLLISSKPKILKSQLKPKKSKKILPIINPDDNI